MLQIQIATDFEEKCWRKEKGHLRRAASSKPSGEAPQERKAVSKVRVKNMSGLVTQRYWWLWKEQIGVVWGKAQ